jgi:hypothetical protein
VAVCLIGFVVYILVLIVLLAVLGGPAAVMGS